MPADTRIVRFGFSPCPNDTFQFYALIHRKIDTGPLRFEPVLADVEALNRMALAGELELVLADVEAALSELATAGEVVRLGTDYSRAVGRPTTPI